MRSLQEIILESRDAVLHGDAGPAYRCLKELRQMRSSPQLSAVPEGVKLDELERALRFVALPELSPEEAAEVLRTAILPLLGLGIDLDDRLSIRQSFVTYGEKDADRQFLRQAILENTEKIGALSIAEWLHNFDKTYNPETREPRAVQDFFTRDSRIVTLSEREKTMLKIVLNAYENWLSVERLTVFDLAYLKQNPENLSGGSQGPYISQAANVAYAQSRSVAQSSGPIKTIRMPLLKAMSEYKHLSEQMLTEEKIKLKSSMEPVRPSLGNWLKSYREELGIGVHEPVQRGNFLFQSQNGKHLSNEDRARMNLVLKSIEEQFPLEIDPNRQVIIFPRSSDASMELAQVKTRPMSRIIRPRGFTDPTQSTSTPQAVPATPAKPSPLDSFKPFFAKPAAPEKNVSGETLHFSTGHVLPAERETGSVSTDSNEALRQMHPPTSGIERETRAPLTKSPYSIRPLRSRSSDDTSA